MATAEPIDEPEVSLVDPTKPMTWLEKVVRLSALTKLAHPAMMLDKIGKQNERVLKLADAVRNGTIGKADAAAPATEDDMGVNVGNEIHYHYQNAQAPTVSEKAADASSKISTALKVAAVGAALLGSGGIGSALTMYLSQKAVTKVVAPPGIDPNKYDIGGAVVPFN